MNLDFQQIWYSIQDFFRDLPQNLQEFYEKSLVYFKSLSLYEMIAWGGNGLGLVLLVVGLFLL